MTAAALLLLAWPAWAGEIRLEAPAPRPLAESLVELKSRGWTVLPPGTLFTPAQEDAVLKGVEAYRSKPWNAFSSELALPRGAWPKDPRLEPAAIPAREVFAEVMPRLMEGVQAALDDGGPLALENSDLRLGNRQNWGNIHQDGLDATVVHAFSGRGPVLYPFDDGVFEIREVPERHTAVFTGLGRLERLGQLPLLHDAPRDQAGRVALVGRLRSSQHPSRGVFLSQLAREHPELLSRLELVVRALLARGVDPGKLTLLTLSQLKGE